MVSLIAGAGRLSGQSLHCTYYFSVDTINLVYAIETVEPIKKFIVLC